METSFYDSTIFWYALAIIFLACLLIGVLIIKNRRENKKREELEKRYNKGVDAYFDDDEQSKGSMGKNSQGMTEPNVAVGYNSEAEGNHSFALKKEEVSEVLNKPTARFSQKIYYYMVGSYDNKATYTLLTTFQSMRIAETDTEFSRYIIKKCCEKNINIPMKIDGKSAFVTFTYIKK